MPNSIFNAFDNIIAFDLETTGIDSKKDEIIDLAVLRAERSGGGGYSMTEFDVFIKLSPGRTLPPFISNLTGITEQLLADEGISKEAACGKLEEVLSCPNPLFIAYNAQFDLCFLYYFLHRLGRAGALRGIKMLDALTVYKDRRDYPHKLSDAVDAYSLATQNTHRAIDDARATLELIRAMEAEQDDLDRYVNLFGYNPKYGVSGPRISSVNYAPQGYGRIKKLYEE